MQAIQGIILIFGVCLVFAHSVLATSSAAGALLKCDLPSVEIDAKWQTMDDPCINKMREQVQEELKAAMTYMAMGAHFARDTVNRPGFSKMFFESANEEREHAIKIIEYLLMRGAFASEVSKLINNPRPVSDFSKALVELDGQAALQAALKLETHVTEKIRGIIKECEKTCDDDNVATCTKKRDNDYHLVDYLTGDFLEEQYRGQRDFAGKISTLGKMMKNHGPLGEFLFDKKLLNGTPL